jgi:DNA-binding response OmpR family regulator
VGHGNGNRPEPFPMAKAEEESTSAVALVVDDEDRVRRMLSDLLRQAGCGCLEARSAEEALRLLDSTPADFGILDINLPGMSGAELAWRIRERRPEMSLVALSGHLAEWDRDDLKDLGFDEIFPKPMDCEAFVSYCRRVRPAPHEAGVRVRSKAPHRES